MIELDKLGFSSNSKRVLAFSVLVLTWYQLPENSIVILTNEQTAFPPMDNYPRLTLTAAFLAGVFLTLGFKDFYPDLERRFRSRRHDTTRSSPNYPSTLRGAGLLIEPAAGDAETDGGARLKLEDHTSLRGRRKETESAKEGIEGCVGNSPLIRIKSLSAETRCEILGKAEVRIPSHFRHHRSASPLERLLRLTFLEHSL